MAVIADKAKTLWEQGGILKFDTIYFHHKETIDTYYGIPTKFETNGKPTHKYTVIGAVNGVIKSHHSNKSLHGLANDLDKMLRGISLERILNDRDVHDR